MAAVGLIALDPDLAGVLRAALQEDGHTAYEIPFGPGAVRLLARLGLDALLLDGHQYVNTKRFLEDVRAQRATAALPVVVLGPARPAEVPPFAGVTKLGAHFDLHALLAAVEAAATR
jgi:DNA-binding response OmpR family regulator